MSKDQQVIDWCMASLATEPEAWHPRAYGGRLYSISHNNGVSIWLGNSHYGLGICYGDLELGGVTSWSSLFGGLIPWRRRLRAAAVEVARLHGAGVSAAEAILKVAGAAES